MRIKMRFFPIFTSPPFVNFTILVGAIDPPPRTRQGRLVPCPLSVDRGQTASSKKKNTTSFRHFSFNSSHPSRTAVGTESRANGATEKKRRPGRIERRVHELGQRAAEEQRLRFVAAVLRHQRRRLFRHIDAAQPVHLALFPGEW